MQVFNALLALGLCLLLCSDLACAHKKAKLIIGGAAAGSAGAVGAGGGFLAGSHIGSILAKHGYLHGHGKQILLPPKNIYLKHHEPVIHHKPVEHLQAAPAHAVPIAIQHEAPVAHGHDHHHHHHAHIEHEHHHAIEHAEIPHAAPIAAPVGLPIAEHGHFPVPAPHFHHVEHAHHGPPPPKKPEVLYRGNIVIKKKIPQKGHHFSIHGYQFSIGRKPKTLLHKKHFFFHPAPVIVKPFFVKEKAQPALIKAAGPVPIPIKPAAVGGPIEQGPIVLIKGGAPGHGPAAGPGWAQGPIMIHEAAGPGPQQVIKEAPVAGPIIKEAVVEAGWPSNAGSGGESHAPLIKILGPIFDAPLPVIGGQDVW